jgi:hypothetical protein
MTAVSASATAGILTSINTGFGGQWQGSMAYNGAYVSLNVDYCVFKPGVFPYSVTPAIPSSHYVYAYQLVSLVAGPNPSWAYVTKFSVGLQADEQVGVIGYSPDGLAGEVNPSKSAFVTDYKAAGWDWTSPALYAGAGKHSPILYFSSRFAPELDTATVSGFFPVGTKMLPSPVPEPMTLGVLALGAVFVVIRRRPRRA